MRRIVTPIVLLAVLIGLYLIASAGIVTVDEYGIANGDSWLTIDSASTYQERGQCFTADVEVTLDSCTFWLQKVGSPTNTLQAKIYHMTGTYGTDGHGTAAGAIATSDAIYAASLSAYPGDSVSFKFSGENRITLEADSHYVVTVRYDHGDGSNYVQVRYDSDDLNHDGNFCAYGSSWGTSSNMDCVFYVFGSTGAPAQGDTCCSTSGTLAFGNVDTNTTDVDSFYIYNCGDSALVGNIDWAGLDAAFIPLSDSAYNIASGVTTWFKVRFDPPDVASYADTIALGHDSCDSIIISGTGTEPSSNIILAANTKGPNQINLTWNGVSNPGYGYKVEIQSDSDSRYSSWTDYTALLKNGFGFLPYWVTEDHYRDRTDGTSTGLGSACQLPVFGLLHNTEYNFRVRCYNRDDDGSETYSGYSNTATETTVNPTTIRYVRTDGDNGNDGTADDSEHAWLTLDYASSQATAGMLIYVKGGTYSSNNHITSAASGSYDGTDYNDKIVMMAYPGDSVSIVTSSDSWGYINIAHDYWSVDGFTINDSVGTTDNVWRVSGDRNSIANLYTNGPVPTTSGYNPKVTGDYNLLSNCRGQDYGTDDGQSGTGLPNFEGEYNMFINGHNSHSGHDVISFGTTLQGSEGSDYNACCNSLLDGGWGSGFQNMGGEWSKRNLFEGNIVKDVGTLFSAYKPSTQIGSENTIRRNVIYGGESHGIEFNKLGGSNGGGNNNLIYNNVICEHGGGAIWYMNAADLTNNTIANNIIYGNVGDDGDAGFSDPVDVLLRGTYTGTTIHDNIILSKDGADATNICLEGAKKTVADANNDWSTYFQDNVTTAPAFVDSANVDFHLKTTSFGIGEAVAITDTIWGSVIEDGDDFGAFERYTLETEDTCCTALPTTHNYGNVSVDSISNYDFYISNCGDSTLYLSIGLSDSTEFNIQSGGGLDTLIGSAACTVTVQFAPTSSGEKLDTLTLGDAACSSVPLSGTGTAVSDGTSVIRRLWRGAKKVIRMWRH